MSDVGVQLAQLIRELVNEVLTEGVGLAEVDRPNMTERQLFEYLLHDLELPVTRHMIKYAVMRREIVPTQLGNGNYFSKRDGLEWIKSRKR